MLVPCGAMQTGRHPLVSVAGDERGMASEGSIIAAIVDQAR